MMIKRLIVFSKSLHLTFLILAIENYAQTSCPNYVKIEKTGVEFCLPSTDWEIELEDGLRFISMHESVIYSGTNTFTIRMEVVPDSLSPYKYAQRQFNDSQGISDYKENIVDEGYRVINGKEFYFSKIWTSYKSFNGVYHISYAVEYYFWENKIGYVLSHVVSNKEFWDEDKALEIWSSFKIVSPPDLSIFD